jgi:hypothetical protein
VRLEPRAQDAVLAHGTACAMRGIRYMTDALGARADPAGMAFIRAPANARSAGELRALLEVCQSRMAGPTVQRDWSASRGQDQPNLDSRSHRSRLLCPSLLTRSTLREAESGYPLAKCPTAVSSRAWSRRRLAELQNSAQGVTGSWNAAARASLRHAASNLR